MLKYGSFITAIINFLIIAMIIFLFVRTMNKINESIKAKIGEPEIPIDNTKTCPFCKEKIVKEATRCPHCTSILDNDEK